MDLGMVILGHSPEECILFPDAWWGTLWCEKSGFGYLLEQKSTQKLLKIEFMLFWGAYPHPLDYCTSIWWTASTLIDNLHPFFSSLSSIEHSPHIQKHSVVLDSSSADQSFIFEYFKLSSYICYNNPTWISFAGLAQIAINSKSSFIYADWKLRPSWKEMSTLPLKEVILLMICRRSQKIYRREVSCGWRWSLRFQELNFILWFSHIVLWFRLKEVSGKISNFFKYLGWNPIGHYYQERGEKIIRQYIVWSCKICEFGKRKS